MYNRIYADVLRKSTTILTHFVLWPFPDHWSRLTVCLSRNISNVASVMPMIRIMNIGVTASILTLVHGVSLSSVSMGNTLLRMRRKTPVSRSCCNLGEEPS